MTYRKKLYTLGPWGSCLPTLFQSCADRSPRPVGWDEVCRLIGSDPDVRQRTLELRALLQQGSTGLYGSRKSLMPALAPAAAMEGGHSAEHIRGLTGVAMVDLDGLDPDRLPQLRQAVDADPHTFLSHITCSGRGLRILFRYVVQGDEPFSYHDAWLCGNQYYAALTATPFDPAVKDATRLSFLAHDPHVHFCPQAKAFAVLSAQGARQLAARGPAAPAADPQARLDLAWQLSLRAGHQWAPGGRHAMMLDLARLHCRLGLDPSQSEAYLAPLAPRGPQEAHDVAAWCYTTFADQFGCLLRPAADATTTSAATPAARRRRPAKPAAPAAEAPSEAPSDAAPTTAAPAPVPGASRTAVARYQEIGHWLADAYQLRQNEVRRTFEYFDRAAAIFRPLTEYVRNSMMIECDTALGRRVRRADFDAVIESTFVPRYNPFREYLGSLPEWDGHSDPDYIGQLCATVHTTSPAGFFHKYFEKWFVGLIPAMLDSAQTNQVVLIFTGPQGTYKSTFFRELLPPELRDYFLSKTDPLRMDKDARLALSEFALICLEEIGTMTPRELDTIKGIITQTIVSERAPYQHTKESRPHIASFCGTSNETALFGDRTGLRRWLAFQIESIDRPNFDYRGLYSQAFYLYRHGFQYWFDAHDIAALAPHMEQFKEPNLEEEQILRYYRPPSDDTDPEGRYLETHTFVTTAEILERCASGALRGQLNKNNIGRAMHALGFRSYSNGRRRGYIVHEIDLKENMDARTLRRRPPAAPHR